MVKEKAKNHVVNSNSMVSVLSQEGLNRRMSAVQADMNFIDFTAFGDKREIHKEQ